MPALRGHPEASLECRLLEGIVEPVPDAAAAAAKRPAM
jgi:hypothetical protein